MGTGTYCNACKNLLVRLEQLDSRNFTKFFISDPFQVLSFSSNNSRFSSSYLSLPFSIVNFLVAQLLCCSTSCCSTFLLLNFPVGELLCCSTSCWSTCLLVNLNILLQWGVICKLYKKKQTFSFMRASLREGFKKKL